MKIKYIIYTLLAAITIVVCACLTSPQDVSKHDLVSGLAIDYSKNVFIVTAEICTASTDDFLSKTDYVKGTGFTVEEALYNAELKNNNLMFLNSVQLYLISESASKKQAVADFLASDSANVRAVCVTTKSKASKVLKNEKDSNTRAKSLSLAYKIKQTVGNSKHRVPNVISFLKNDNYVYINKDGLAQITGVN